MGTIKIYFIGITAVIITILCLVRFYGTEEHFHKIAIFFGGICDWSDQCYNSF